MNEDGRMQMLGPFKGQHRQGLWQVIRAGEVEVGIASPHHNMGRAVLTGPSRNEVEDVVQHLRRREREVAWCSAVVERGGVWNLDGMQQGEESQQQQKQPREHGR